MKTSASIFRYRMAFHVAWMGAMLAALGSMASGSPVAKNEQATKPAPYCFVHNQPLKIATVKIEYGLIRHPDEEVIARAYQFPYANQVAEGGCVVEPNSPHESQVYYCDQCRAAETAWKKAHPRRDGKWTPPAPIAFTDLPGGIRIKPVAHEAQIMEDLLKVIVWDFDLEWPAERTLLDMQLEIGGEGPTQNLFHSEHVLVGNNQAHSGRLSVVLMPMKNGAASPDWKAPEMKVMIRLDRGSVSGIAPNPFIRGMEYYDNFQVMGRGDIPLITAIRGETQKGRNLDYRVVLMFKLRASKLTD